MFGKIWTVAAAAAIAGVLALPAPSAYAQAAKTAPVVAKSTIMKHAAARHRDCYDLAWQSQAMKDCMAKGEMKKPVKKASSKKMKKKKMS